MHKAALTAVVLFCVAVPASAEVNPRPLSGLNAFWFEAGGSLSEI